MLLVTDASVVVKSVLTEDDSEAARQLMNGEHELHVPVYDCVYLALAHQIDGTLVTADARFVNTLAGTEHAGRVVLLADFAPAQG